MKLEISRQIFEKYAGTQFLENPSSGNRVIKCGRTDGQAGMAKLGRDHPVVFKVHRKINVHVTHQTKLCNIHYLLILATNFGHKRPSSDQYLKNLKTLKCWCTEISVFILYVYPFTYNIALHTHRFLAVLQVASCVLLLNI